MKSLEDMRSLAMIVFNEFFYFRFYDTGLIKLIFQTKKKMYFRFPKKSLVLLLSNSVAVYRWENYLNTIVHLCIYLFFEKNRNFSILI